MGRILGAYLLPHPPIIVPEIGNGEEAKASKTIRAMKMASEDIRNKKPDTIILITPHGPVFSDGIAISYEDKLIGDFNNFGRPDISLSFDNDKIVVDRIINQSANQGIMCAPIDKRLAKEYQLDTRIDHGALVPLYYINNIYKDYKLVHITYGLLSHIELYKFGMIIRSIVEESSHNVVFIASGDLSHKLTKDAPAGYNIRGKEFDQTLVNLLETSDWERIMSIDSKLAEAAGECGLRSLYILSGFLDGYKTVTEVLSYEGPFGVGYCVCGIETLDRSDKYELLNKLMKNEEDMISSIRNMEDEYVRLARNSLEYFVNNEKIVELPRDISKELINNKAGVFVSIKKDGMLRGCIGTIGPTEKNIATEIIKNAIKAGTEDPRFFPVEEDELDKLVYSVDVLKELEDIGLIDQLDVYRYGVIVSYGNKSGLLLPNLEGVDTPEEQVSIALKKAGISANQGYRMQRFEVIRHH